MEMKLMINEAYAKHVPKNEEKFSLDFPIPSGSIFDQNFSLVNQNESNLKPSHAFVVTSVPWDSRSK